MKKQLLALSLAAALFLGAAGCSKPTESSGDGSSAADGYPEKAITVIVPFSAGGEPRPDSAHNCHPPAGNVWVDSNDPKYDG